MSDWFTNFQNKKSVKNLSFNKKIRKIRMNFFQGESMNEIDPSHCNYYTIMMPIIPPPLLLLASLLFQPALFPTCNTSKIKRRKHIN